MYISHEEAMKYVEEDRGDTKMSVKPYNEYLGMSAEALIADPDAPESLKIAARIELEKAKDKPQKA